MPKDEFDFEDPFELNGMALLTHEDTTDAMAKCFIEEFMRMGYNHKQILAVFRNPEYLGPKMVLEKRGETFVRETIADIFTRWRKPVTSDFVAAGILSATEPDFQPGKTPDDRSSFSGGKMPSATVGEMPAATDSITDPMGGPIPDITI